MSFNFVEKVLCINGGEDVQATLQFFNKGFVLGGGTNIDYRDVILSGIGSLTLVNAKANGLNYVKLFGGCSQASTPTPSSPVNIVCNNGAIKYSVNMANVNEQTALVGCYISGQGVVTADSNNWIYQEYIPVEPETTYTLSFDESVYYVTISEYSTNDDSGFIVRKAGSSGSNTSLTITTEATTNYIRFGTNINRSIVTLEQVLAINWMLNQGNILPYAPYSENGLYIDGIKETVKDSLDNTATAENLFAVNSYKDVQEVLTGEVTRNVAIKVLDGTETWSKISNQNAYYMSMDEMLYCNPVEAGLSNQFAGAGVGTADMPDNSVKLTYTTNPNRGAILFKHNATTTLEDWVQFVKDQYDLGNPIIALYPLATPTTESVTGQPLTIQAGTNIVEITQASIDNLELEVSYKAGVEVTVEEIENTNLSNQVTVTIGG